MYEKVVESYPNPAHPTATAIFWFLDCWRATIAAGEEDAVKEFMRLVRDEPLEPADNTPPLLAPGEAAPVTRVWAPLKQYGNVSDVARVRPDLLHQKGWTLNGRVGKIAGMRRGDVILVFDTPVMDGPDEYRGPADHFEIDISQLEQ
jgi:hypothetical protein